eukprot:5780009-Prorocentrum_lima.AAC.1
MTSSLVGSEMCIRDRGGGYGRCLEEVKHQWHSVWQGRRLRRAGPQPKPVSYTHLTLPTICSV